MRHVDRPSKEGHEEEREHSSRASFSVEAAVAPEFDARSVESAYQALSEKCTEFLDTADAAIKKAKQGGAGHLWVTYVRMAEGLDLNGTADEVTADDIRTKAPGVRALEQYAKGQGMTMHIQKFSQREVQPGRGTYSRVFFAVSLEW